MPHEKTIKDYIRWNPQKPGFNDDVLRELSITYELERRTSYHARAGHLAFDAMSVKEEVVLNRRTLAFEGLQDVGNLVSYTNKLFEKEETDVLKGIQLAKQCLQVVFISMDGLHKVPIAYFLVETENATLIVEMVYAAVMRLMTIRLDVVSAIGDGSGPNRSAFEQMVSVGTQTVKAGSNWNNDSTMFCTAMPHPHPGRRKRGAKILIVPDYVHGMKKSVAVIHSSGTTKGKTRLVRKFDPITGKWQHLEWRQCYAAWVQDRMVKGAGMLAPKVTREHMLRSSSARLRVRLIPNLNPQEMGQGCSHLSWAPL